MASVDRAYFCYPLAEGLVEAAVMFAQAAKEQNVELIVNMSHKQSRPFARSKATQNHWLSEQLFDWSGVPSTHLRITFFAEWLLYIAPLIRYGRYAMPTFLELLALQDDTIKLKHFEAVTMDQQEGLLAGTDNIGTSIIGRPLTTLEQFLTENWSQFFLPTSNKPQEQLCHAKY
jgi:hypothetical protein